MIRFKNAFAGRKKSKKKERPKALFFLQRTDKYQQL